MPRILASLAAAILLLSLGLLVAQEKAPDSLVYEAKFGKVTFDHKKHTDREGGKCEPCHDQPFAKAHGKLGDYKLAMHKKAEASKASCATCHHDGGKSFASKGNCNKCHAKKGK
ncbi:MAG: cytochrome C [Bryobacterales bacterium]|nr:cytochrome C [Bryobacterales bacterium]